MGLRYSSGAPEKGRVNLVGNEGGENISSETREGVDGVPDPTWPHHTEDYAGVS